MTPAFSLFFSSFFQTPSILREKGTPFSPPVTPKQWIEMDKKRGECHLRPYATLLSVVVLLFPRCLAKIFLLVEPWNKKDLYNLQERYNIHLYITLFYLIQVSSIAISLISSFSFLPFDHTPTFWLSVSYDDHLGLMTLMMMMTRLDDPEMGRKVDRGGENNRENDVSGRVSLSLSIDSL